MQSGRNILNQAGQVVGKRQVRFGTNAIIMTVAFIAILVLINILVARTNVRWDLTATGEFSLSPETIAILADLEQPVEIIGFFNQAQQQAAQEELRSRLESYAARTDLVSYEFVDPDVNPTLAQSYNVAEYGTVVVESQGRQQQTVTTDEQSLTRAILRVTQETPPTVYFLTGHDERSPENLTDRTGYGTLGRILEEDGFVVETLNLVVSDTIPLESSVLVVADPQLELPEREQEIIAGYIDQGGSLLLLGNPFTPAPLAEVLEQVGLAWNDDLLADQQLYFQQPLIPIVNDYSFSPITSGLTDPAIFPTVRTLTQTETLTGTTVTELLSSSPDIQIATSLAGNIQENLEDAPGPRPFGYSVEITASGDATANADGARMVVLGDADFAGNEWLLVTSANRDLARNAVGWLMTQAEEFTLPPRTDPVDRSLVLTGAQGNLVFLGSTIGLPLLVIVVGVVVWWQRR